MSDEQKLVTGDHEKRGLLDGKAVSRREFLKMAGIAGATVGLGAGLGGLRHVPRRLVPLGGIVLAHQRDAHAREEPDQDRVEQADVLGSGHAPDDEERCHDRQCDGAIGG